MTRFRQVLSLFIIAGLIQCGAASADEHHRRAYWPWSLGKSIPPPHVPEALAMRQASTFLVLQVMSGVPLQMASQGLAPMTEAVRLCLGLGDPPPEPLSGPELEEAERRLLLRLEVDPVIIGPRIHPQWVPFSVQNTGTTTYYLALMEEEEWAPALSPLPEWRVFHESSAGDNEGGTTANILPVGLPPSFESDDVLTPMRDPKLVVLEPDDRASVDFPATRIWSPAPGTYRGELWIRVYVWDVEPKVLIRPTATAVIAGLKLASRERAKLVSQVVTLEVSEIAWSKDPIRDTYRQYLRFRAELENGPGP